MLERTLGLTLTYAGDPDVEKREDAKDVVAEHLHGKPYEELKVHEKRTVDSWIELNGKKVE